MRNVRAASFALGLALLALASPAQAVEYGFPVALRQLTMFSADAYGSMSRDQGYAALYVRPEAYVKSEKIRVDLGLDAMGSFSTRVDGPFGSSGLVFASPNGLRAVDTQVDTESLDNANLYASLDIARLDIQFTDSFLDLDFGRQPISLGSSHFLSVLDILAPFGPGSLDSTFKPGIDALRARRSLGDRAELELILAAADPIGDFAALLRSRFSVTWADIEVMTGRFRGRMMGGLGLETEAGPVGIWAEGAIFQQIDPAYHAWSRYVALSGTAGIEGRPHDNLMLSGGALWQDFGARSPDQYLNTILRSSPHREGWVYLLGSAYGFGSLTWQAHPLINVTGSVLVNVLDGSTMSQPGVAVNIADNADLTLVGWICTGAEITHVYDPTYSSYSQTINSEFGLYPSGGGLYARWFF